MFPVGYKSGDSDFGSIGKTGGEKTHTLTIDEMPSHQHNIQGHNESGSGVNWTNDSIIYEGDSNKGYNSDLKVSPAGSNKAHNNLPPFKVVAYWKRVS